MGREVTKIRIAQMPARRGAEPEHRTASTALPPTAGPLRVKARCTPLGRASAQPLTGWS